MAQCIDTAKGIDTTQIVESTSNEHAVHGFAYVKEINGDFVIVSADACDPSADVEKFIAQKTQEGWEKLEDFRLHRGITHWFNCEYFKHPEKDTILVVYIWWRFVKTVELQELYDLLGFLSEGWNP